MNEIIEIALNNASVGQLAVAIQKKLVSNAEVKIKPQWIRVQHTTHCDRLLSAQSIDLALSKNLEAN